MWAAMEVLRGKRNPMRAGEIYAEVRERKLAPGLKGKTPERTLAAQLAVSAKRRRFVERTEPGKFRLKRGSCTRSGQPGSARPGITPPLLSSAPLHPLAALPSSPVEPR